MIAQEELAKILENHGYIYVKKIGEGGNGQVFLVTSKKYQTDFCCKVRPISKKGQKVETGKLDDEIALNVKLQHPNIISLFEHFTENEFLFIIMEYCPNGNLDDYIKTNGPIQGPQLFFFCKQIILAIKACHDNYIAHRDIKPSNILLDAHMRLKLVDFGISADLQNADSESFMRHDGSRAWMAPEIFQTKQAFDPFKADIWAMGVTFYQMVLGKLPWIVNDKNEMMKSIKMGFVYFENDDHGNPICPFPFQKLIKRMLDTNPSTRATLEQVMMDPIFDEDSPYLQPQSPLALSKNQMTLSSVEFFTPQKRKHPRAARLNLRSSPSAAVFNSIMQGSQMNALNNNLAHCNSFRQGSNQRRFSTFL